ncbi:MAG: response regulator [Lachnospiraceae bacterium]|nr:response regulator [Lachnospiraceae bacterium]
MKDIITKGLLMDYSDIIQDRFAEPAAILSYKDGTVSVMEINSRYIPELWMNVSEEDYLGANFQKSYDDENLKLFKNAVEKCVEIGEDQTVETWRSLFSDCCGYDKICLLSRLILVEKTGDGAVIYEGIRNISNEKRAQETLTDIEYRYKAASEQINIYNWEYDVATKEMRPCYRCMRDLGLPALVTNYPEPAIDAGIFPPDYADMYRDMMRRIDEGAPELEADIPLTVGRVPFRVKYTTEFDEQGKPVKAFGSATLISETELGHIKLDNQIIGTLAEGYAGIYLADFIKDEVQVIKADDILNIAPGSRCTDLATAIRMILERIDSDEKGLLSDIDHVRVELFRDSDIREFVYKDEGTDRWVRIAAHQMEKGSLGTERMLVTVSVIDDVRAQKMDADRLIAAQKNELEDRQVKLLKAIDEANRANKAKTEFFSNMSHDIRTPMNAITGFSRLAKDEIDDRKHVEDYLDKIVSAGDHLMSLINDILDMSRIESGKMELSPVPVRIKDLVANCADMIRVKMDEKKLDFIVDASEAGDDIVACDKLRFDQVVLNLLSNAYKFTPEGGRVFLEAALKDRKDKFIYEIRVRDTGIGMSAEYKDHIWEAFTRENSTTVNETQGTGLGMLIVRNIVDMMHGNIELITEKGKGSEFIITLPLEPSAETGLAAETDTKATDAMNRKYTGVTVLVVDDTPLNLKLAERILETFDFTVKKAESGVAALDMVKVSAPGDIDLILMDVCMPVMDGLETTAKIRELDNAGLARIPIIAMTANAFETDVEAALRAGMNAHIAKPFKKEDLIATISAYIPE